MKGGKRTLGGSRLGLFIPQGLKPSNLQLICEGESDTAAALTLGIAAIGLPSAGQAIPEALKFVRECKVNVPCIVADNGTAGRDGAENLAEALLTDRVPCRVLYPPDPHEDLREWVTKVGLTAEQLRKAVEAVLVRYPEGWAPGFMQVPNALIREGMVKEIGAGPFALACAMKSYHGKNGKIFPARDDLARLLGVSISTVDRHKRILEENGIILWTRGGDGRCNEYTINFGPVKGGKKT